MFKGIAIIMVVLVHISQSFSLPKWMTYVPQLGQLGCQIFFVLSSYTLCFSLDRKNDGYMKFQKRRWLRIIPGYYSMILAYLILGFLSVWLFNKNLFRTSLDWKHIIINIFLLNGFVPGKANNLVVRGGWYIGTSIIFYLLMPLLYRIYSCTLVEWRKNRIWLFPFIITLSSACTMIVVSQFDSIFSVANNSFAYFSFVNQLPSFSLGFSLYDWKKNYQSNIKGLKIFILCFMLELFTVILFYSDLKYAFVFVPTIFSAFFCVLFSLVSEKIERNLTKFRILEKWGEYSFAVYLVHSLIAWEGSMVMMHIWQILFKDISEVIAFIIWLPIAYLIIWYVGKVFSRYLSFLEYIVVNERKSKRKHET